MNNPVIELNPFPEKRKKYLKSRKQKNVCFFEHYMKCTSCFSILLVSIVIFFSTTTSAQRFDSILSKLDKEYPQEKLYLQFDRQIYYPGETIWFKAYLFAGNDLSLISKTLYAELIDEKGKVVERKTAPLFESSAAAAFDIPPDIRGQVVYVRAYTKWMINFDSSFTFVKTIPLLNRKTSPGKVVPPQSYLQFFPEGGDLVLNLPSKVAFKGTDEKGQPINIKGSVIDARGKNIVSFKSSHDGMGFFLFQPTSTEGYKAIWKDDLGLIHENILPTPKRAGIVVALTNSGKKIDFIIRRSQDSLPQLNQVYIVAHAQQQLLYRARASLVKGPVLTGSIPIGEVPAGIIHVTIFDGLQRPIAERIVFANQQEYYFITDLNGAEINMNKRKKNVLQVDVPDTLHCNLSVAVTDGDLNPASPYADNIFSHILLTSDIKGYVHDPGYYFSGEADTVVQHLDLVMLTNGWRRFKWEDVLADKFPVIQYKPDNYLAIEGKIYGLPKTSLAHSELTGILELKNKNKEFLNTPVTTDGTFSIPGMIFYDTAHVYYQFNNDKNKTLTSRATFEIKNNLLNKRLYVQPEQAWMSFGKKDSTLLAMNKKAAERFLSESENQQKVKVLEEVIVKSKQKSKKQLMEEEYTSGFFKGADDITFITEDDPSAISALSVFNYLQGRVAGLSINVSGAQPSLSWRGGNPTLFLNEIEHDVQTLQNIPMSDVAMIKVFRPPFFGAIGGGSGGAIAVYLKKGASVNQNFKGLDYSTVEGYSNVKEYYSPDYSKADINLEQNDYRSTLYWKPFVLTDKNHRKLLLSFYNNDLTKKIRVIIEGCNSEGKLTRIEKVFQ